MPSVNWTNVTTLNDWLQTANTTTSGWFWSIMLYVVAIVIGLAIIPVFGLEAGLLVACFIGLMVGFMLSLIGLVSVGSVGVFAGILLFTILYIVFTSNKQNQ